MARKPTGGRPGRPRKPSLFPEVLPKPTKQRLRALVLERRIRFPKPERVTLSDLIGPEPLFQKGERGLSTRKMEERLRSVSYGAIHNWRHDPIYERWFRKLVARSIGRKLRRRAAPVTNRTKGGADNKLMQTITNQLAAQEAAKRSIKSIKSPLDGKEYEPKAYLKHVRHWRDTGSQKMQERHPGWSSRALWHGDKPTEWFLSQEGDREPEPAEGGWKFEPEQGSFHGKVEFFKKGNIDCIRIITTNPGVRTTKLIGSFKRKGKSVRKQIAKRGDVLEVYEGKATSEYVDRFPKEWEAYQVAQRKDEN